MSPPVGIRRGSPHPDKVLDVPPTPKKKCCSSKPACKRCPLQMMINGTLPEGYTVKKRKLVKIKKKHNPKTKVKVAA